MSSTGTIGVKISELESKIAKLDALSDNIASCANNAGVSVFYGPLAQDVANAPFVQSKGASASTMIKIKTELTSVTRNISVLVKNTSAFLSGAKNAMLDRDEQIGNEFN